MIWSLITFSRPTYGSVSYPDWGTAVGWCMITFCVIWIPIVAIVKILKAEGNLVQVRAKNPTVIASNLNFFGVNRTICAFFSSTSSSLTCFSTGFLDQNIISSSCIKVTSTLPCFDEKIKSNFCECTHTAFKRDFSSVLLLFQFF